MKKKSIVAGALALSMVLAGTGYAYWTDSLNITTNATTGNMNVKFMDLGLYAQYSNEMSGWSIIDGVGDKGYVDADYFLRGTSNYNIIAAEGTVDSYYKKADGYNDVNFSAKLVNPTKLNVNIGDYKTALSVDVSDNIDIAVNNMYPGYAQAFRTDIGNVGNVAAKLSQIKVTSSGNNTGNIKDMMGIALMVQREYCSETKASVDNVVGFAENFDEEDIFTLGGVDFVRLSAVEEKGFDAEYINNNLLVVPSENRMDAFVGIAMDPDAEGNYTTGSTKVMADNNDELSMNKGVKISIDFLWDQFNEGIGTNAPANILAEQNK